MKLAVVLFFCAAGVVLGQTSEPSIHPGVVLFQQARFSEAIRSLEIATKSKEHKADADLWNHLGLAYLKKSELKKSYKAFEKSVALNPSSSIFRSNLADAYLATGLVTKARQAANKAIELNPKNSAAYLIRGVTNLWENKLEPAERDADSAIALDPSKAQSYLLKSETLLAKLTVRMAAGRKIAEEIELLKTATEVLESGADKTKGSPHFEQLQRELESVSTFYKHFTRNTAPPESDITAVGPGPVVTPLRILSKKPAAYTDVARSAGIEGVIRVAAIFGETGKIESVLFLKRLGYGLEQSVLAVVGDIKFEPRRVNGRPVSSVRIIEYTFDIY